MPNFSMAEGIGISCLRIIVLLVFLKVCDSRRFRFRDCLDDRLKDNENDADVVITGTVKRLHNIQGPMYSGEVQVKRVIKGDHIKVGETLLVEGFGKKDLCSSDVRNKDSKIFLLTQLHTGSFRLNSTLLQVNVPNLDRVIAAVKDEPYRRRSHIQDVTCEKKYCAFNGDCYVDGVRGLCRCGNLCRDVGRPICASDGLTYGSECQMRVDSCRKQQRTYLRNEGICFRQS